MNKHDWHKQMAAKMARASTDHQMKMAQELLAAGESDGHIILQLERKFFLSRRPAEALLDLAKADRDLGAALQEEMS